MVVGSGAGSKEADDHKGDEEQEGRGRDADPARLKIFQLKSC